MASELDARVGPLPAGLAPPDAFWDALIAGYATPPRWYHTIDHVVDVARWFHTVPEWAQPREVFLAVLFHDVVYDAARHDNEARSADVAQAAIERWLPDAGIDVDRVRALILATASHGRNSPELDEDTRRFLDCDMAILAAEPDAYRRYADGVRAEYTAAIPPDAYDAGRAAFLRRLVAAPRLFLSDAFHAAHDAAARRNLAAELAALGG
jgi:predicted metal-dependent HD superfamily phosphohydrolase